MTIIEFKDVSLRYRISRTKPKTFQEYLLGLLKGNVYGIEDFWALKDISFVIKRGTHTGIIGQNGAGKSTLLKVIAGVIKPTEGLVRINGNVAPLIELGTGFDMDLTGEENVYLNGSILGLSRREITKKFDEIIDFSELKDFIYSPLRTYSSGMIARLAFSIAINIDADILIVDEALSVGDESFRKKCKTRINEEINKGTTLIFVSHNMSDVINFCDEALWLHQGRLLYRGDSELVSRHYMLFNNQRPFEDVNEGYKYKQYIDRLFVNGVANGEILNGKRYFIPERQATRAEFMIFLARIKGISKHYKGRRIFDDVDENHWAFNYASWLYENGYAMPIKTDDGRLFLKPDDFITYDETRKIIENENKDFDRSKINFQADKPLTRGELAMILTECFQIKDGLMHKGS
jgi:ABC-2 type transport system ATP-binding protein/lipopolysaccharide transport system ATP-binding protein